jgi:hypothetical protein
VLAGPGQWLGMPRSTIENPELERWVPDPTLRVTHRREAHASPQALWQAAATVRLEDCRLLGRLVRWRIPGLPRPLTYRELFRREPFVVLEEGECSSLSGLCGRIWTLRRDYPRLERPEDFTQWHQPGTARVLFAHWAEPAGRDRAALISQTHIAAGGRGASRGIALVRPLISAFEHLIDREPLAIAARRAEQASSQARR